MHVFIELSSVKVSPGTSGSYWSITLLLDEGAKKNRNFRTAKKPYIQKVVVHNVGRFHTLYYFGTTCTSVVLPHIMEIMFTFEKKIGWFVDTVLLLHHTQVAV